MVIDEDNFKKKSAKFLDFLDKAEEIDAQVEKEELGFSADNLDISFDKTAQPDGGRDTAKKTKIEEMSDLSKQVKQTSEQDQLILEAKKKYNQQFFMQFAFQGEGSSLLTQKAIEEHISKI